MIANAFFASTVFSALTLAADFTVHGRNFTLPEGFVIERVAGPPLVKHPVHAAFDDKGRLLVTEVSGSNAPIAQQLKTLEHKVVRLTDDNNDGIFDRSEVWAKDLPMPQGIMWLENSAYVAAPPAIWKLTSKPDDTGSQPKTAWYDAKTATGCNNDLHGPWLGPDGWIYWTKGAFAEQTHELTNGKKLTTKASMLLRRKPEGGPVDVLMCGGMDNPVGLAFLPGGDRIVSATFLHHPGGGLRDGLIHALYGGVYGKDHDAINGLPRTGDLLPVMTDLGPAAPSSVIRMVSESLGFPIRDNLFLCQFNLRKVSRHEVVPKGASYSTKDFDFLSSSDLDFHPTDVLEFDRGLLVVDTGGWYKLCCPTSQLEKPEVPGAIYRITGRENRGVTAPLRRSRPQLKKRPVGEPATTPSGLRNLARLQSGTTALRRAIEYVGANATATKYIVDELLYSAAVERDRAIIHAIRYALWELDSPALIERLADMANRPPLAIAAAIWAIFQNPSYAPKVFDADRLLGWAENPEPELAAAARMALGKRPEYATKVIDWLKQRLTGKPWADGGWESLRPLIVAWLGRSDMQYLLAEWTANRDAKVRSYCWSLMADHRAKSLPSSWREAASRAVASADAEELAAMLPIIRRVVGDPKLIDALRKRSSDRSLPNETRFALLTLAPSPECDQETFGDLTAALGSDRPVSLRLAAADALGAAKLTPSQATVLTAVLLECGPLEIERLLAAFTATKNAKVGEALVAALERAKARKALRIDDVKKRLEVFGPSLKPAIDRLAAKFAADRAGETKRLDELTNKLPKGDAKRGLLVFNGTKASCRSCHKLGYVGGDLGPDLSKIGSIRSRRDLLESTVFPNASFVRSYEPTLFQLHDGRNVSGLVRRETAEEIVLATGLNQEQRIAKKEIEARLAGTVSIMPTGMDQQLSPQELADLIAFLESAK